MSTINRDHPAPEGPLSGRLTLEIMRQMILDTLITEPSRVNPDRTLAERLFLYVQRHVPMHADPTMARGVIEQIKRPDVLMDEIARHGTALGDCDDMTTLLGALYRIAGFPGYRLVALSLGRDAWLDHVFGQVQIDGAWISADAAVKDQPFGWTAPEADHPTSVTLNVWP